VGGIGGKLTWGGERHRFGEGIEGVLLDFEGL
jgi:hypothetical protein